MIIFSKIVMILDCIDPMLQFKEDSKKTWYQVQKDDC